MWLNRSVYESLPYAYMLVGAILLVISWLLGEGTVPRVCLFVGAASLLAGLVLWLRRKDSRALGAEYDAKSLDD
jgi:hypothetical protein